MSEEKKILIAIADDYKVFREGLKKMYRRRQITGSSY